MRWSYKIGRIAGIGVYVHATFLLLIAWLGLSHYLASRSLVTTVQGVVFVLAVFGCVVLHEFGHALTARRFGVKTRDIVLLPIGGVARLERIPDVPAQELWIAAAGPAVNVVIAALLYGWLRLTGSFVPLEQLDVATGPFAERLLVVNLFLVLFNLLPAFPMDGGRVLRALLAFRLSYARATRIAASVGQGLALLFGLVGLFSNPFLLFIAFFVWIGAAQEAGLASARSTLRGVRLEQMMVSEFHTVHPEEPLGRAVELTLAGSQKDFPVVDGERVVGILTQDALFAALARTGAEGLIGEVMNRDIPTAELAEPAPQVFTRLQTGPSRTVPVTDRGRLVGLVTLENVAELLAIYSALEAAAEPAAPEEPAGGRQSL
jgi:Zn-dependent protease